MIVVLGAFGKTGSVVSTLLTRAGREVRRVTRDPARIAATQTPAQTGSVASSDVALTSWLDDGELDRAVRGASALYAILPDDLGSQRFHAERRAMADALARAIARERVPRVVLLSSRAAALGEDAQNGLGKSLAYFERVIFATKATVSVLRASYFQDNVLGAVALAKSEGVYLDFLPADSGPLVTIASADVGAIAARSLLEPARREREIVDLVGPMYLPADIAATLARALGRGVSVSSVPTAHQEQQFRRWMSPEAAQMMVELFACLGTARLASGEPGSDRVEHGTTRLDQVLARALEHRSAVSSIQEVSL